MEGAGLTDKIIQFIDAAAGITETQQQGDFLHFFPQISLHSQQKSPGLWEESIAFQMENNTKIRTRDKIFILYRF